MKKVRFIPSPHDVPSRNTSKPASRESLESVSHKPSFPNNRAHIETLHQKHGFQTEFFDDMQFPDQDILEEDIFSEEEEEEKDDGEGSSQNYDIEYDEEQNDDVEDLVEEVWGKNNQDMNF